MFLPSILESSNNFQWFVPAKDTDEKGVSLLTYAFRLLFEGKKWEWIVRSKPRSQVHFYIGDLPTAPATGLFFPSVFPVRCATARFHPKEYGSFVTIVPDVVCVCFVRVDRVTQFHRCA